MPEDGAREEQTPKTTDGSQPRRSVLRSTFGRVTWEPPDYLARLTRSVASSFRSFGSWRRRSPRAFLGWTVALFLLLVAGVGGYQWYLHRPQPHMLTLTGFAPEATKLEEDAKIDSFEIEFSGSAARLEDVGKDVPTGIQLTPPLKGSWRWTDDTHLVFQPVEDWGVGQDYVVRLDPALFPEHVLLETYEVEFHSAAFEASLSDFRFYQDPRDPKIKKVVATLEFSHPVDGDSLERRVSMKMTGDEDNLPPGRSTDYAFTVTYDEFHGEAYLHSEPIPIPPGNVKMNLEIAKGVRSSRGGNPYAKKLESNTTVPGMYHYFRVSQAKVELVRNERDEPEQMMLVTTTVGVLESELQEHLSAWLLPVDRPATPGRDRVEDYDWGRTDEIGPEILGQSMPLTLEALPTELEYSTLHSFRLSVPPERHIYMQIRKGVEAYGGYVLSKEFDAIREVPSYPREVRILHEGALLSMSGEKKLSVLSRGVSDLRLSIGRIDRNEIKHLVTQTRGSFSSPRFRSPSFNQDNLTRVEREIRRLAPAEPGVAQYTAYDFSTPLEAESGAGRGLLLFRAEVWDPENERPQSPSDTRLVLITDLGVLVKRNRDGSQDVFVQSIASGAPVEDATIEVLGKNGVAIVSAATDDDGHARFPTLKDFEYEQEPTVYLVTRKQDLSFLPYERRDRGLEFSRFDVGGVSTPETGDELSAYLFSDRGIYRPGDRIHAGLIVRSSAWEKDTEGVPIEISITDPRGSQVSWERRALPAFGFDELEFETGLAWPTGTYTIRVHLVDRDRRGPLLGSTSVKVEEFLPDRMKIRARLDPERSTGWVSPRDLRALVTLTNLYGTPATGRRITAQMTLVPGSAVIPEFSEYRFFDPVLAEKRFQEMLDEARTDDSGEAAFALDLERFADATYRLTVFVEGFEADGGRSVAAETSVLVSPLSYLVGWKADGDLGYVKRDSERSVEWIGVGPDGKQLEVSNLKLQLVEERHVSVLTEQPNGTYQYESKLKEVTLRSETVSLPRDGLRAALSTDTPGSFALIARGPDDTELNRVRFTVVGAGNLSRDLEKNAELELRLEKDDFEPGEPIEMQIVAPYRGAGLITVESDRVYAYKWFRSESTTSVQTIRVPDEIRGNGYVVVSFVRAADSEEIFMSPLSYAAAPFSVSRARQTVNVDLAIPELGRPGEDFEISYASDRPGRIALFAVDEGILQVARYRTPDPLGHFFKKRALEVRTSQILDLILPEFSLLRRLGAEGGGAPFAEEALGKNLNPFKRRRHVPVAWWSGIVESDSTPRRLAYTIPDHFNGTLHVFAVVVSETALGVADEKALVRGHFVLGPNVPTFVAPGDEFEVSVTVANNVEGSGETPSVALSLETSEHLEVLERAAAEVVIAEGRETSERFRLRARDLLGSARLRFEAALGEKRSKYEIDLSVRPPQPYRTVLTSGYVRRDSVDVDAPRDMYPHFAKRELSASTLPVALARGLLGYLEGFPYGCTEQIVSKAFPALALRNQPELGFAPEAVNERLQTTLSVLRSRQNGEGAFGFWAANSHVSDFQSVYAAHFLTEARESGYPVPRDLLGSALGYLEKLADQDKRTLAELRVQAYAIYLLTRNGRVTTKFLTGMLEQLEKRQKDTWRADVLAAYVAGTYQLLQQEAEARRVIRDLKLGVTVEPDYGVFYDGLVRDAQLLSILAKHFPEQLRRVPESDLLAILNPIAEGRYNTISSAYAILALSAYSEAVGSPSPAELSFAELLAEGKTRPLVADGGLFPTVSLSEAGTGVRVSSSGDVPIFYQLTQAGFDRPLPEQPLAENLEIQREYHNAEGEVVDSVALGGELEVHLHLRTIAGATAENLAVVDLLPGGFEIVRTPELRRGTTEGSTWRPQYVDLREDRLLIFGTGDESVKTFVYRIRATNRGSYVVPPTYAESMYDRTVYAQGLAHHIEVAGNEEAP